MSITINVICYKVKPLKNNEYPLMLRITKDRKRKYFSLGVSVKLENWDFSKNQPKPNTPNRELILKLIDTKIAIYREAVLEYKSVDKDFTLEMLIEKVEKPVKAITVGILIQSHIDDLRAQKRYNYAISFQQLYNSMLEYNKHLNIYFSDISISWLKGYETYLKTKGLKVNTIGIRFRTLRALYNLAIEKEIVKSEYYPFKRYKVSKLYQNTVKRAISKDEIISIMNYDANGDFYTQLAINLFSFSYLLGGINFVDMAYLTTDNIIDGKLIYTRKKTGKLIQLPLHDKALSYVPPNKGNELYLFPILSSFHKTEQQKLNRTHKVIAKVNRKLKQIGNTVGLSIPLTTYVARHSYATVLKRSGVSTSIISESLGHSNEKITQVYLDSFENEQLTNALVNLL